MVLVLDCLEEQFLGVLLVVEAGVIMGVEDEEGKQMVPIPSSLVHSLEEDQGAVIVEGKEDKLQGKISQEQDFLDWKIFSVEVTTTAVIVLHNPTTMVDTMVVTIMDTIMDTTMVTTVVEVDTTVPVVDTTMVEVDTTVDKTRPNSKGASTTTG